jgi:shikimate dehydrogenase
MRIDGHTRLIAHLGFPTASFKAPLIYNPWFSRHGVNAVVVPMGVTAHDYPAFLSALRTSSNFHGALVTMPHKITTCALVDRLSKRALIAGACNAILKLPDGQLLGDQFDGAGFVTGLKRKGQEVSGKRALLIGCGGVGSAIAASLAEAGIAELRLFDALPSAALSLQQRLHMYFPLLDTVISGNDPADLHMVINASPLGMQADDALPIDITRLSSQSFVGDVVLTQDITPLLQAALDKGCRIQTGSDMLVEMIPEYLRFFGFGSASVDELRLLFSLSNNDQPGHSSSVK